MAGPRADRGRIAGRSIRGCITNHRYYHTTTPRGCYPRGGVGVSSRAVAADGRSDRSRSRCRPLSRDQHETSSSHRDRGRNPRITATDDRAYDSARPPLSLRGLSTTPYSRGSRRTGSSGRCKEMPVREDEAVVSAEHWAVRRHESRELATCVARERDGDEIQQDA